MGSLKAQLKEWKLLREILEDDPLFKLVIENGDCAKVCFDGDSDPMRIIVQRYIELTDHLLQYCPHYSKEQQDDTLPNSSPHLYRQDAQDHTSYY